MTVTFIDAPQTDNLTSFVREMMKESRNIDKVCIYYCTNDGEPKLFVNDPSDRMHTKGFFHLCAEVLGKLAMDEAIEATEAI